MGCTSTTNTKILDIVWGWSERVFSTNMERLLQKRLLDEMWSSLYPQPPAPKRLQTRRRYLELVEPSDLNFDFPKTVQALEHMRRILEGSGEKASDTKYVKYSLLRYQYTRLVEALPPTYRSIPKDYLLNSILKEDDAEQLDMLSAATTDIDDKDIGTLLAVKHLTALAETGDLIEQTELVLNQRDTLGDAVEIHHLASLAPSSEHILVEWLRYKEPWADNTNCGQPTP
ncbi:hypothetical protein V8F06_014671 [Rhypophila decipiens]